MNLVHVFSAPQSAYFFMTGQLDFMQSKGVQVTVVMPKDELFNPKFKKENPNVKIINIAFTRKISLFKDIYSLFCLIKIFYKIKSDIIHLHTPKASLIGGLAGRFLFKKNIIYQMHGLVSINGNNVKKGLVYKIEKLTCLLSTRIFAVSKSLMEFSVANDFCEAGKISVINNGTINGINFTSKFNPANLIRGIEILNHVDPKIFIIGFVGRVLDDKGIFDYLEVLSLFKQNNLKTLGVIVGPDESEGEFSRTAKKLNLIFNRDIIFFGQQFNPENFMNYFDILLLPTKREGFGLVAAEANALGKPVVGYNIPGFRDAVVNEVTGILVDYGDKAGLYDKVLNYYLNPELKLEHGENGRKRVKKDFKSVDIWEDLYKEYRSLIML